MKRLIAFSFLAVLCCLIPASRPAQAKSLVSVLATVPDSIFHAVTIGTDSAEYVGSKIAYGTAEIDTVADSAVNFFHAIAHPTSAAVAAKAQAKAAKKAAKKAAAKKSTQLRGVGYCLDHSCGFTVVPATAPF